MPAKISQIREKVDVLYQARNESRADWADWLYAHHIFVVADYAGVLADRFGGQKDVCMAVGMLHDVADSVTKRENPEHERKSLEIARAILRESGFTDEEVREAVDDAIRFHSCHGDEAPQTLTGKILATADALAHLMTDFYSDSVSKMSGRPPEENRQWVRDKIERDFSRKIFFDEVREETRPRYEELKRAFAEA